jgi:hypothetical protein
MEEAPGEATEAVGSPTQPLSVGDGNVSESSSEQEDGAAAGAVASTLLPATMGVLALGAA